MSGTPVTVIGAGLAGSEAAWQLAKRGIPVRLMEMKPQKMTPAHHAPRFGELVCSNSLRSDQLENAVGLLKEELRRLDSLITTARITQTQTTFFTPEIQRSKTLMVTATSAKEMKPCQIPVTVR